MQQQTETNLPAVESRRMNSNSYIKLSKAARARYPHARLLAHRESDASVADDIADIRNRSLDSMAWRDIDLCLTGLSQGGRVEYESSVILVGQAMAFVSQQIDGDVEGTHNVWSRIPVFYAQFGESLVEDDLHSLFDAAIHDLLIGLTSRFRLAQERWPANTNIVLDQLFIAAGAPRLKQLNSAAMELLAIDDPQAVADESLVWTCELSAILRQARDPFRNHLLADSPLSHRIRAMHMDEERVRTLLLHFLDSQLASQLPAVYVNELETRLGV